jgi:cytochrome c oxidase assembly protein subunit 15
MTALTVLSACVIGFRIRLPVNVRMAMLLLGGTVMLQFSLGVATLLSWVALPVAVAHQGTAVLLLAASLMATHTLRGAK